MFHEFRFGPAAIEEARKNGYLRAILLLLMPAIMYGWLYWKGELIFNSTSTPFLILPFLMAIGIGVLGVFRSVQRVRSFRLIVTPEGLQFSRGLAEVRVAFSEIARVVTAEDGSLLVYSVASPMMPFLMIPKRLENIGFLAEILKEYVAFDNTATGKIPRAARPVLRWVLLLLIMSLVVTHLLSENPYVQAGTGLLLAALVAYQLIVMIRFRRHLSAPMNFIFTIVILLLLLFRVVLVLMAAAGTGWKIN